MRKFSPLAEDVSHLTSVLQDVSRVEEAPDSGMDFLDEEDLLVGNCPQFLHLKMSKIFRGRRSTNPVESTVYRLLFLSRSPSF